MRSFYAFTCKTGGLHAITYVLRLLFAASRAPFVGVVGVHAQYT